ncbi:CLUMA_CG020572, isoform A [Clunio marinus]|uniref:CLUMA_CG020572, isoform A n=1 Tax=Clunio marinus TaxID=568069 RepID=A0A1J1J5E0_9DIPT|nr:CLUMA_CG020572, isoform A [Clunio marinus]
MVFDIEPLNINLLFTSNKADAFCLQAETLNSHDVVPCPLSPRTHVEDHQSLDFENPVTTKPSMDAILKQKIKKRKMKMELSIKLVVMRATL